MDDTMFAQVYNYIYVDAIDGKPMQDFTVKYSKKRKGLFAPKIEIIFLKPGDYAVTAHGKTYQTTPQVVTAHLEAGKYYCLGANEDGVYLDERPFEWTQN